MTQEYLDMAALAETAVVTQCGREFTSDELADVRAVVEMFSGLTRTELARTLCENLGWFTASGGYKIDACLKLLEQLSGLGHVRLLEKFRPGTRCHRARKQVIGEEEARLPVQVCGTLREAGPVSLELALEPQARRAWKQSVERYHYLGYKRPFGCHLEYFVESDHGRLGCVLVSGAAKAMSARDRWIGWTVQQRLRNLAWVVNNQRFLLFPGVQVKHLASHVLGQVSRRLRQDWYARYGYRPVLLETFVDPKHYEGTCYRAAGWLEIGRTTGAGLCRPGCMYSTTPKKIFVQPLTTNFRALLCSETLKGKNPDE